MFQGSDRVECENCGALLPAADEGGTRTCQFCKAVYHAPAQQAPAYTPPQVTFTPTEFQPINAGAATSGCGIGALILTLVILASVLIPLYFAFRGTEWFQSSLGSLNIPGLSAGSSSNLDMRDDFVVLPAEPGASPPLVAIATHYDSGQSKSVEQVVKLDGKSNTVVWTSADLGTSAKHPIISDGTHALVGDERMILAVNLSDGKTAWQAPLADKLTTSTIDKGSLGPCGGCFAVVGPNVIAKTDDGTLAAFATGTGAPAWSKRLTDVNARVLRVGERLVVVDGTGGDYAASVIDPATGADAVPPLNPVCQRPGSSSSFADGLGFTSTGIPAGDGSAVDFVFGSGYTCIQRWDINTGQMVWSTPLDPNTSFSSVSGAIDSGGVVAVTDGKNLVVLDAGTGAPRAAAEFADATPVPVGVTGNVLVMKGQTTRGTTKNQLWGVNIDGGAPLWTANLADAKSVDPPADTPSSSVTSSESVYTANIEGTTIHLISFSGSTKKLTAWNIDATNGATGAPTTLDAKVDDLIPNFGPASWQGSRVTLLAGDQIVTIQTAGTPSILYNFPG